MIYKHSITVDVVIFTIENGELKILLIKRAAEPYKGEWALPGGFLAEGESTEKAAKRILADKAGVKGVYIEQLYTFDDLKRDPRGPVISVTYFALVERNKIKIEEGVTTQSPTFHPIKSLPNLAFDHKRIVDYSLERLGYKLQYTNVAYALLPKEFTLSELQKAYEVILGKRFDKRNFRKKFLSLDLIVSTRRKRSGGRQRPAELFRFRDAKPIILERFF